MSAIIQSRSGISLPNNDLEELKTKEYRELIELAESQVQRLIEESQSIYDLIECSVPDQLTGALLSFLGITELRCHQITNLIEGIEARYQADTGEVNAQDIVDSAEAELH